MRCSACGGRDEARGEPSDSGRRRGVAPDRISLLRDLIGEGLDGLESHHRSFDPIAREKIGATARALGLVETGGTDYHGDTGPYAEAHAGLVMPDELVAGLRTRLGV